MDPPTKPNLGAWPNRCGAIRTRCKRPAWTGPGADKVMCCMRHSYKTFGWSIWMTIVVMLITGQDLPSLRSPNAAIAPSAEPLRDPKFFQRQRLSSLPPLTNGQ